MACTLESEDVSTMEYERIRFGSLNEVINDDDLECFDKGYGVLKKGVEVCLDQVKARREHCITKAAAQHEDRSQ